MSQPTPSRPPPPRRPPAHNPTQNTQVNESTAHTYNTEQLSRVHISEPSAPSAPPTAPEDTYELAGTNSQAMYAQGYNMPITAHTDTTAQSQHYNTSYPQAHTGAYAQNYNNTYPHAHEGSSSAYPTQQEMLNAVPYNQAVENSKDKKSGPNQNDVSSYNTTASAHAPYAPGAAQTPTSQLSTVYSTSSMGYPTQYDAQTNERTSLPHYAPPAYEAPEDTAAASQFTSAPPRTPPRSQTPPARSPADAYDLYEQQQYMQQPHPELAPNRTQPHTNTHTTTHTQPHHPAIVVDTAQPKRGPAPSPPPRSPRSSRGSLHSTTTTGSIHSSVSLNARPTSAHKADGILRYDGEYKWDTQLLPEFTFPPLIPPSGLFPLTTHGAKDLDTINVALDHQRKQMQAVYQGKISSIQGEYFRSVSSTKTMKTLNNLGGTFSKLVTGKEDDKREDRKAEVKEKKQKYMERAYDSYYFSRHTLADAMATKEVKALKDWHIKESADIVRYEKVEAKNMATRHAKESYDLEKRHKKKQGGLFTSKKKDVRLEAQEKETIQGRFKAEQIEQHQRQMGRRAHLQQLHIDQIAWVQRHFETFKYTRVAQA